MAKFSRLKQMEGFNSIWEWMQHVKKKSELKAALRRNPKPAKVRIPDEDVPEELRDERK